MYSSGRSADVNNCVRMAIKTLKNWFSNFQCSSMPEPETENLDYKILYEGIFFIGMFFIEISMTIKITEQHRNAHKNEQIW